MTSTIFLMTTKTKITTIILTIIKSLLLLASYLLITITYVKYGHDMTYKICVSLFKLQSETNYLFNQA